uniref:Uncharacterized protein LOC108038373 n=1 Tax=Drosophila rhopaloa TaxID=1041015 RepID=A0A6P4EBB9_DRORH
MEAKVHRQHQRHRRTEARQRRLEREAAATGAPPTTPERAEALDCATALNEGVAADPGGSGGTPSSAGRISAQSSADSIELVGSPSQTSQQTVVLVNGHAPPGQGEGEGEEESPLGAGNPRESPPPPSKLYSAGGISSILKELADDIAPADGEEIYNPFTPVVSPTDDAPAHIDKMFLQTSSGYRPVEHSYYKRSFLGAAVRGSGGLSASGGGGGRLDGISAAELGGAGRLFRSSGSHAHGGVGLGATAGGSGSGRGSYGDTRCLLDADFNRNGITSNIQLACVVQRIWLLISNICHGLLAGLALAHLLFVLSSHPMDWAKVINGMSLAGETMSSTAPTPSASTPSAMDLDPGDRGTESGGPPSSGSSGSGTGGSDALALITDYAGFAEIYLNTFYCLAIICLVSVFDRMDICRWSFSNASELISFRWLIITMIYVATIILTICSDSIDEKLYLFNNNANITLTQQEMLSNSVQSVWSSLSVTRSIAAISGWIMIGLTPQEDMLYEHLVDLTKYQLTNN